MALLRSFVAVTFLLLAAPVVRAQQVPTPAQARRLLEARPDLIAQLRREIANTRMTPDQIRARLRAVGYPEDFLDSYIGRPRTGRDSLDTPPVSEDILDAVAALGITDSVDTAQLRDELKRRRGTLVGRDSMRVDDVRLEPDSILPRDSLDLPDSLGSLGSDSTRRLDRRRAMLRRLGRLEPAPDSGFSTFGLNIFSRETTQFDPNLAGPVDANYRLGPGDRLVLIITGDAERSHTLDVTREGFIVIPGVGEIPVANLTLAQLEDVLYTRLGRVYSGLRRGPNATTRFSLSVARLRSNQIFVLGDVEQPGSYRVSSAGTALTALYAARGPNANGSLRRIEVRRGGRLVDTLDLYDYLLRADGSHDPRLFSGDVVFVPVHGPRVRIYGEVVRPATYELRPRETLADVLQAAGGFTADAARRRVQITRVLPPGQRNGTDAARVVMDLSSEQLESGESPPFPLEPGDVIRVFRVAEHVSRQVTIRGSVWTPGVVAFAPGLKLSDAIHSAGGLKPDTYLAQVLVSRLRPSDGVRVQMRTAFTDTTGKTVDDITLREDDEIRVFSVSEFRPVEYVAITGAVRKPGRYAYHEGMTLRDLVLLAGGLEERAYVPEAEIARLPRERDGGKLAISQRVPMDSSYLLPRVQNGGSPQPSRTPPVTLEAFDNVLVLAQPDWERTRRVVLMGEVRFPGTYTLLTKSDRLTDVLQRAGGLTSAAYPDGIAFYRARLGRVGIDLPQVLRDQKHHDNLILQDGDSVQIPQFNGVVDVQGEVNSPRGVAYRPGADLNYYVRAAGGGTRSADLHRAYVTQPDGNVESVRVRRFLPDGVPEPRPGSVVYVTQRDANDRSDGVARLGVLAQILGTALAIVAVVRR